MKIVLDTNVLVSGLLSPYGAPAEIVGMVSSGVLRLCYDARVMVEYQDVLARPKFQFDQKKVKDLLVFAQQSGEVVATAPLNARLPDIHDEIFLEVALAGRAVFLITGNIKHFPASSRRGVNVVTPQEFLGLLRHKSWSE
ncbi:MAG: putative toxin-antitoxin system toxin component, PIN family [Candidatus Omnitrophica bacterium]|nr:putative toxin-antitoxin system toxin component, PIN family [Candidatus Omnitrophota bacterium]